MKKQIFKELKTLYRTWNFFFSLWTIFLLSDISYCTVQNSTVLLDFGTEGILIRDTSQIGWAAYMVPLMSQEGCFSNLQSLTFVKLIRRKEFETLEKIISQDTCELNISFYNALELLSGSEKLGIISEYRLNFFQRLSEILYSTKNITIMEFNERFSMFCLQRCTRFLFTLTMLEVLCKNLGIPFFLRYEENFTVIHIIENFLNVKNLNMTEIQHMKANDIHIVISLTFLHFLTQGSISLKIKDKNDTNPFYLFRYFYESNEITHRTVNFDYSEFNSFFWCYKDLFGNVEINFFIIEIYDFNMGEIARFRSSDLRKQLRIKNMDIKLKNCYHLEVENISNSSTLETIEISMQGLLDNNIDISFSDYTIKKCTVFTITRVYFCENLYQMILKMENLEILNICRCEINASVGEKMWKNPKILNIVSVLKFNNHDIISIQPFFNNIKYAENFSIDTLSIGMEINDPLKILHSIFRCKNIKNFLKVAEITVKNLTNELLWAILNCDLLERIQIYAANCLEPLKGNGQFECKSTLKSVNFVIDTCSSQFSCTTFDDFEEIEQLSIEIPLSDNVFIFFANSMKLISMITVLEIAINNGIFQNLNNLNYAIHVRTLILYVSPNLGEQGMRNVLDVLKTQAFVRNVIELSLNWVQLTEEASSLIKTYQKLKKFCFCLSENAYTVDFSLLSLPDELLRVLHGISLHLKHDVDFFGSFMKPFEILELLVIKIQERWVFNDIGPCFRIRFPSLRLVRILQFENFAYSETERKLIRAFHFVDVMEFEIFSNQIVCVKTLAIFFSQETLRPKIIKLKVNGFNFVMFRE